VPRGLQAEYFAAESPGGTPDVSRIDLSISTAALTAAWRGPAPPKFSVRWFGYLTVPRSGRYTIATTSDDGSAVSIDGALVLDNTGPHSAQTKTADISLTSGPHAVLVEYVQYTADYEMSWMWARTGRPLSPVPSWVLSPRRIAYWKVMASRALELASLGLAAAGLLATIWVGVASGRRARRPALAALGLFVALAIVHTWPIASDPAHLARNDNGDAMLNEWIIAWVAHQAPRDPLHLFDANIFYPERHTLAYSEAMIVQSAMAAPILWLGGSPVLAYNLVLIAGFALTGWAMCLVIARWTDNWVAGIVAGMVFGFNAHTLTRIPHLQAQHGEFLPFAIVALDGLLRFPGVGRAARLALWFVLQALTSIYLLVITFFALLAGVLARPEDWRGARFPKVLKGLVLASIFGGAVLLPFVLPYWEVSRDIGVTRSLRDTLMYSASWGDYVSTPARVHVDWGRRFFVGNALFPGVTGLALTVVALVSGVAFRDRRARMCLAAGVAGVYLSFGPKAPGYATLHALVPLLQAVRAASRFGYLAIFAVAGLAGFGVVVIQDRIRTWRPALAAAWPLTALVLLLAAALEPLAAPLGVGRFEGIPAIYSRVPRGEGVVVAEFPFHNGRAAFGHAVYMLNSTANWQPLVNGYSGFQPPSFYEHVAALESFPDARALAALRRIGVTHVIVHTEAYTPAQLHALESSPGVRRIDAEKGVAIYAVQ
jgi:hypothetical protein